MQASVSVVRNSEVVHYSGAAIAKIYRDFSWYIEQCPLLGRGPLMESTLYTVDMDDLKQPNRGP